MLIVRGSGALEVPVGKVLLRGAYIARFSPAGDRIAYELGYDLHVMDLSGHELEAVARAVSPWLIRGFAWSPSGQELWFATFQEGDRTLRAVSLAGKLRVSFDYLARSWWKTSRGRGRCWPRCTTAGKRSGSAERVSRESGI